MKLSSIKSYLMSDIEHKQFWSDAMKMVLFVFFLVLIGIPLYMYYDRFSKFPESNDPAVWGTFGDFVGGVLNPIIALASLVVLAYISIQISNNDSEEKHKYFLLEKKINAFENLTETMNEFRNMQSKSETYLNLVKVYGDVELQSKANNAYIETLNYLKIMCNEVSSFPLKYDHLFVYDFSNDEFKELLNDISKYEDEINESIFKRQDEVDSNVSSIEDFVIDRIDKFIEELRKELDVKKMMIKSNISNNIK